MDKAVTDAVSEFDFARQDAAINKAWGTQAEASPAVFVCHDLNLRVLAPTVHGFVQPQAWIADFTKVTVES